MRDIDTRKEFFKKKIFLIVFFVFCLSLFESIESTVVVL